MTLPATPIALARRVLPTYKWAAYHQLINRKLVELITGNLKHPDGRPCKRLMINLGCQHAKSTLTSHLLPPIVLSQNPCSKIILLSYSADLAASHSAKARDYFSEVFPDMVGEMQARNDWHTNKGGYCFSAGLQGSVTGRGANLIIVDDCFKGLVDASSPIMREKAFDTYMAVAKTRLTPDGAVLYVGTPFHPEDLRGKLLELERDKWVILNFPALAEEDCVLGRLPGEPLWPARYPLEWYHELRDSYIDSGKEYIWQSLYQCDPKGDGTPREFSQFLPVPLYDEDPDYECTVLSCDPSKSKSDKVGDYAAFTLLQVREKHAFVKSWALRTSANAVSDMAVQLIEQYKPQGFCIETTMFQELFMNRIQEKVSQVGMPIRLFSYTAPTTIDKKTKIRVMLGHLLQQKRLHLYSRSPATRLFQSMLSNFPHPKEHDDLPDSLCMALWLYQKLTGKQL